MIKISRIKFGLIKAKAKFIADYCIDNPMKAIAEQIVEKIEEVERDEQAEWDRIKWEIERGEEVAL